MGRKAKAAPTRRKGPVPIKTRKKGSYNGEDFGSLVLQLKLLGLAVRKMEMDGNCLFRAFADQLCGDCEEHQQFRDECCDMMLEHAEEFELFHADEEDEDSVSFETYVHAMRHSGKWGSQLELMALCRRYTVNAIVHQSGRPAYEMGTAPPEARCIQLSYHDGEHYNSIRFPWDMSPGQPAQNVSLLQLKGAGEGAEESVVVRQVRDLLPPEHGAAATAIRAALVRARGDTSLAAEYLLTDAFGGGITPHDPQPEDVGEGKSAAKGAKKSDRRSKREQKAAAGPPATGEEAAEKLSMLAKQLLSV